MNPAFTLTQTQLAALTQPPQQEQRARMLREMEALWHLKEPDWKARFMRPYSFEERRAFFGAVHDWGRRIGLRTWGHYLVIGVLLMRAFCYGWPTEDIEMAKGFIEVDVDEPAEAINWLQDSFDQ